MVERPLHNLEMVLTYKGFSDTFNLFFFDFFFYFWSKKIAINLICLRLQLLTMFSLEKKKFQENSHQEKFLAPKYNPTKIKGRFIRISSYLLCLKEISKERLSKISLKNFEQKKYSNFSNLSFKKLMIEKIMIWKEIRWLIWDLNSIKSAILGM